MAIAQLLSRMFLGAAPRATQAIPLASAISSTSSTEVPYYFRQPNELVINTMTDESLEEIRKLVHDSSTANSSVTLLKAFSTKELDFFVGAMHSKSRRYGDRVQLNLPNAHHLSEIQLGLLATANVYLSALEGSAESITSSRVVFGR